MKPMGGRTWKYWPASGPVFGMLSSRAIQNIPDIDRLSVMVNKLDAIKIYETAESGNSAETVIKTKPPFWGMLYLFWV